MPSPMPPIFTTIPTITRRPTPRLAVKTAQRAVVWLNPDHVIVHDIAATTKAGLFKQFNLVLMATPKIAGNTATAVFKGAAADLAEPAAGECPIGRAA